jgi:mycothiol synthase
LYMLASSSPALFALRLLLSSYALCHHRDMVRVRHTVNILWRFGMDFIARSVSGAHDFQRIQMLIEAAWRPYGPSTYYHVAYICLRMRNPDYINWLTLWETPEGELAGFSEWDAGMFEWQVHPDYLNSTLMMHILDWHEQVATWRGWRGDKLDTLCAEEDTATAALLELHGYMRTGISYQHHLGSLEEPILPLVLPDGYTVRTLHGSEEIEARVAAHCAGMEIPSMTMEEYRRLMHTSCYRSELDIVVIGPHNDMVACCNVWLDDANGVGVFEPLSTLPAHRGKGLAHALVRKGMQQLQQLGARQALVLSASASPHAGRLYTRCGLPIVRRDFLYQKPIAHSQ